MLVFFYLKGQNSPGRRNRKDTNNTPLKSRVLKEIVVPVRFFPSEFPSGCEAKKLCTIFQTEVALNEDVLKAPLIPFLGIFLPF